MRNADFSIADFGLRDADLKGGGSKEDEEKRGLHPPLIRVPQSEIRNPHSLDSLVAGVV
jgi:hypothetical protein